MTLDPTNGVPLYRQLADALRVSVASGQLSPGEELPSLRELAADLRVNYHTVRRGFQLLEDEGLIERQRGGRHRVVLSVIPGPVDLLREEARRMAQRTGELGLPAETAMSLLDEALIAEGVQRDRELA